MQEEILQEEIIQEEIHNYWFIKLNEDNRIVVLCKEIQIETNEDGEPIDNGFIQYDFPQGFDLTQVHNYKLIGNELVYEKMPIVEIEPQPSLEERLEELQEENDMLKGAIFDIAEMLSDMAE